MPKLIVNRLSWQNDINVCRALGRVTPCKLRLKNVLKVNARRLLGNIIPCKFRVKSQPIRSAPAGCSAV